MPERILSSFLDSLPYSNGHQSPIELFVAGLLTVCKDGQNMFIQKLAVNSLAVKKRKTLNEYLNPKPLNQFQFLLLVHKTTKKKSIYSHQRRFRQILSNSEERMTINVCQKQSTNQQQVHIQTYRPQMRFFGFVFLKRRNRRQW